MQKVITEILTSPAARSKSAVQSHLTKLPVTVTPWN